MISCTFEDGGKASLRHVVVHGIIEDEGKLLLVKRAPGILEAGKWSLPSGFMNRDETAPECIVREILEETGWQCQVITLFRINTSPDRPHEDRQNVVLEYLVKPLKLKGQPDKESTKVEWISIENLLPYSEFAFDHGESISLYLKYRKEKFTLPIVI